MDEQDGSAPTPLARPGRRRGLAGRRGGAGATARPQGRRRGDEVGYGAMGDGAGASSPGGGCRRELREEIDGEKS